MGQAGAADGVAGPAMLPMTLDMPDDSEGTRALKMTTARSVRFFVNLGLGLVFHGLLVKCCAMSLFERS